VNVNQPPPWPPPYTYPPPPEYDPKAGKTSGLAVTSLVAGILGFITFGVASIVAIITGHIALRRTRRSLRPGHGMALAGTILGYLGLVGVILVAVLAAAAGSTSPSAARPAACPSGWAHVGTQGACAPDATNNTPGAAPATTAPAPAPAANPDGTVSTSCDEDLGGGIYSPTYLTGEADLANTGNVGITVTVKFAWHQEAYPDVTAPVKTVRLRPGQHKVARFRVYSGTFAGSTALLDRYDSWQNSHGGNPCKARVRITGTFGAVQG
jgi:hypothetical protein